MITDLLDVVVNIDYSTVLTKYRRLLSIFACSCKQCLYKLPFNYETNNVVVVHDVPEFKFESHD